ncbi:hypothetical protein HAX54_009701 [Datura stramonium]|uniref:Uncharacterized protein n=1 Tax=Datura stramonium TaxID=4076 RepID=A0ABS8WY85_DATST|nr:hypothetical protein [Datura stramonium]
MNLSKSLLKAKGSRWRWSPIGCIVAMDNKEGNLGWLAVASKDEQMAMDEDENHQALEDEQMAMDEDEKRGGDKNETMETTNFLLLLVYDTFG